MDLKPMSPEMDELRNVIISSNLASCYLVLELLKSEKNETLTYEGFKNHWMDIYKSTYGNRFQDETSENVETRNFLKW